MPLAFRMLLLPHARFARSPHATRCKVTSSPKLLLFSSLLVVPNEGSSETWFLIVGFLERLRVTQRAMERAMLEVALCDKILNTEIRRRTIFPNLFGVGLLKAFGQFGSITFVSYGVPGYPRLDASARYLVERARETNHSSKDLVAADRQAQRRMFTNVMEKLSDYLELIIIMVMEKYEGTGRIFVQMVKEKEKENVN
ncbi:hypothetical protein MSG28_013413 [Choristoneura fumiferana]|uniref:Uncharacterized protein n=1 Tax=Choristoneura fumiferana TaxID=7141 RepID=A0ACC0KTS1_CHOFU|nr:hypothetical protein MSG28_013413 [Choristoneura fumiferana]